MQWVGIDKVKKSDGTAVSMGDLLTSLAGSTGQLGPFPIIQTGLTSTKDVIATIPLGFIGSIVGVYGIYTTAAGSSLGVGTLDFVLSGSGQVQSAAAATITLTLSHTATLNTIVSQSAVPALHNAFVVADTLTIHYTQTTTFASDTGVIWVYIITS